MFSAYKKQGKTLYDGLMSIYEKYGYFLQNVVSIELEGIEGSAKIKGIMKALREKGFEVSDNIFTIEQGKDELLKILLKK